MKKIFTNVITTLILCMVLAISAGNGKVNAAQDSKEMNIYGIYLESASNEKGDSVLLESKGNFLLMDVGSYANADAIIKQLKAVGAKKIEVYISHLHIDHLGGEVGNSSIGGLEKIADSGISITKMYLPDPSLAPESRDYPQRYEVLKKFMEDKGKIVYLNVGSTLTVGDVKAEIIGPLDTNTFHPQDYEDEADLEGGEDKETVMNTYYENNCSLVAIFTCGKTRFFTAGDTLVDQADILVEKYKGTNKLKADIMKLSHHGTGSGNTEALVGKIAPSYAFASNTGEDNVNPETKKWHTNVARKNVTNTGMCYLIGNQKKTIIYEVKDNKIKMYKEKIASNNMLTGWVKLVGADGEFRKIDQYYLDENGVPLKGVQKIDGKYYYFGKGGCMEYGNFNEKGKYQGWKSYGDARRYYTFSEDKQFAYMARGFKKIGKVKYYFGEDGVKLEGKGETELIQIGKYKYGVGKSGAIVTSDWATIGNDKYYFDKNSRLVTNQIVKIGGTYYYFGKDGKMARASKGTKLITVGKKKYGVGISGALVIQNWATVGKDKYYFGKTGAMCSDLVKKIGKAYYYFGKDGKMARASKGTKLITVGKKKYGVGISGALVIQNWATIGKDKYYFGKTGAMCTELKVKIGKGYYYFGKDGKMVRKKKVTIGKDSYYFGSSGIMLTNTYVTVNGKRYYCGSDGKMKLCK